jgi:hypothetical protein
MSPTSGSAGRSADARPAARADCLGAPLPGADPHQVVDGHGPHLAVADLVGAGRRHDQIDDGSGVGVIDDDLDANLGHEVDLVLRPAVHLGVAALAAEALDLADRHAGDAMLLEGRLHVVELERLDDGGDQSHDSPSETGAALANGLMDSPPDSAELTPDSTDSKS